MSCEFVSVERADHIATVRLNRPPVNALTDQLFDEIGQTFASVADDWDVRVVVLASASEKAFCAGADLKTRHQGDEPQGPRPTDPKRGPREAMWAIVDCPVPVIASVNGHALGGGLALAACCDIVIASERATFGVPEMGVGLLGASSHLKKMVGPARMRELYFTARRVSATEMLDMGGIARVVPHDELEKATRDLAGEIARKSPAAIRLAKEALDRVEDLPFKDAYRTEQDYTARLERYDDSKEAIAAFLEKRDPVFKNR